jgi:hypothetical protein
MLEGGKKVAEEVSLIYMKVPGEATHENLCSVSETPTSTSALE